MSHRIKHLALPVVLLCACLVSAAAPLANDPGQVTATPPAAIPSGAAELSRIENYLNDIRTISADFMQRAPDGAVTEGKVVMERPGKLRFQYQPGVPILVVADGSILTFVDYEVKQVTRWPISDTPLGILVAKKTDLTSALTVTSRHGEDGLLRVVVQDSSHADQGFITLIFEDPPLTLRAWEVTDPQGFVTRITLVNTVFNGHVPDKLFTFDDPRTMPFKKHGPR